MSEGTPATGSRADSRWSRLVSICAELPDIQEVQQLLDTVVHKAAEFFDAECCVVFLRKNWQQYPAAWVGLPERPPPDREIPADANLREHLNQLLAPARCCRFMRAPMVAANETIGDLVMCSLHNGRSLYRREDREMLGLLAHRLAFAVVDARLLEAARAEQDALARIAAALAGEVEIRRIAQTAVDLAVSELGADASNVWIARSEERMLTLLASRGTSPEIDRQLARLSFDAPTLAALAATTGQTQALDSLEQMPGRLAITKRLFAAAGMQSVVAAPLVARDRLMGVLGFTKKTPHHWEARELRLVKTVADLLAAAIFNAQLYEGSERRRLLAEAIIDNSPVAIAVAAGPEHRFVQVNAARERATAIPREKLLGRTPAELWPGLVGGPVIEAYDRVYQTGEAEAITEFQYDFGPPTGVKYFSLFYAPLRAPDGQVESVISLMVDITEQVAARRDLEKLTSKLRAANEQLVQANLRSGELAELAQRRAAELEATIANIADAVFVCDPEGRIVLVNNAGLEMIGIERPDRLQTLAEYLLAIRPRELDGQPVPQKDLAISRALRGEVVRGVEEIVFDSRSQRDRYILVSAAPVRDQEGRSLGAVEVQSDITRIKELDQMKDQFITVAAHEIKTPVTAIKGFAQALVRAPGACAPKYQRALDIIVQQSDRIDALMRDFVDVSRMRWGRVELSLERIDLTALVAEAVARKAATTTKHRLLLTRQDPAWVNGDRDRLDQVLVNLLDNAVKYSPRGGDVEVRVVREGSRAIVSVRDHGVGIPRERQPHIFEMFYRAHIGTPYEYGGLGVGLYTSREIVRRHGGEMWFESEEGRGSTFYFSLPLASDE